MLRDLLFVGWLLIVGVMFAAGWLAAVWIVG